MRTDWLEDLVALLDNGGVVEAARKRNVTQPAFSRRIKALEELLGFDLIDRRVKPSGPSQVLLKHDDQVRRLAAEVRQLMTQMRSEHHSGAGHIVIASQHAITTSMGAAIVKSISGSKTTHIRLRSANLADCETLLVTRQAQIALTYRIASEPAPEPPDFLLESVIGHETLLPVCGTAQARNLMWRFHNGELRVVGYPPDVFLGAALVRHVHSHLEGKCTLSVVTETALTHAALQLSRSGLGVAWVPEALARPDLDRGELVDLRNELGFVEMELVARRWSTTTQIETLEAWTALTDLAAKGLLQPMSDTSPPIAASG